MKWVIGCLYAAVFVVGMVLIVAGQRRIGPGGLLMMLAGLAGILSLLGSYNRKYR